MHHFPSIESYPLSPTSRRLVHISFDSSHFKKPKVSTLERKAVDNTINIQEDISLNDLETEISKIRYRRLSIEEAMSWLTKEKV